MICVLLLLSQTYILLAQESSNWVSLIQQGDRQVFWKEKVQINLFVWNMETDQSNMQLKNLTVTWNCQDLTLNAVCKKSDGSQLSLDKFNYTVVIPESTLSPKRSYQFTALISGDYVVNRTVTLYFSQNIIPFLNISYPYSILSRLVNFDEIIDFSIQLDDGVSPDDSKISVAIYLDGQVSKFQQLYPRLRFQASYYYPDLVNAQEIGICRIHFVYSLQNYIDPAEYEIIFRINYPPRNGEIKLDETNGMNIIVSSVSDTHTPILYKYWFYEGQSINIESINGQYELTDYIESSSYSTNLPVGQFTLVCQLKDSLGATSVISQNVTIQTSKSKLDEILVSLDTETSITKIMSASLVLKYLYESFSFDDKIAYAVTVNQTLTKLKEYYSDEFLLKTQDKYQIMLQKAIYLIESTGINFIGEDTIDLKLQYLIQFQTEIRKDIIKFTSLIQINEKSMIAGQYKGNVTAQELYLELQSLYGVIGQVINDVHDVFDTFLGRMTIDNPDTISEAINANTTNVNSTDYLKELFMNLTDTNNKNRLLKQVEESDLVSSDDGVNSFRAQLIQESTLTLDHFDLIHICYTRLISLVQVLNLIINSYTETNGRVIYRQFSIFQHLLHSSHHQECLKIPILRRKLDAVAIPVFSGYWNLNNDTINFEVQIDTSNKTDTGNYAARRNIYMWENRDLFTNLTEVEMFQINPNYLYLVSIITFSVNPYYWKQEVYEYAKWNQFSNNLKYISPQFIVQNGSDYQVVLQFEHFQFKYPFITEYSENNTRCASIVSNFTGDNCTKSVLTSQHTCTCKYISDIILMEEYIPVDLREIQFVSIENMHLTVIGLTIGTMSGIMILFTIITAILDLRSSRVVLPVNSPIMSEHGNQDDVDQKMFDKSADFTKIKQSTIFPEKSSVLSVRYKNKETEKYEGKQLFDQSIKEEDFSHMTIFNKNYNKQQKQSDDFHNAAVQYEPIFQTNVEMGIKYTSADLVLTGMIKLHELLSIFLYYDSKFSRPSRVLQLYMKLMVMFVVSSYTITYLNEIQHILLIIFIGEISVFFLAIVKAELNGWIQEKIIGFCLTVAILGGCFIYYFYNVIGLQIDTADNWARQFLISYLSNHILFDPIIVIFKILLYPWTLQQIIAQTKAPIAYLLNFFINHAPMRALYQL
ncbi:unnamed protein product (macronuclear) [Paramecium tetraurelia]|uniref:PKD/REJ-like domain-containing protein n=1 Tax=Paramecium tetraurelia TaxID=5888 RepID=A0BUV4_PARTE|nr:uncharacterized protein GSPATT00005567001 [Paramecium tetraurelia]CAK62321.1 unnamed protein product [Paramecium tetraurelia]|eukprot:XP_001429719.1 hypothetical protein (macronuclear) [Paramecium tetraurelia strain d4-2]